MGEAVAELDTLALGLGLTVGDNDGDGDGDGDELGDVVADGEVDGLLEGELDGLAGAELPWAGPTRFGVWTCWWPVNSRATAAMATPTTATAPPVATPAANERRSRRYSVRRRSRSEAGSAARHSTPLPRA